MNKILTLYDLEFKRVKKVYFSILSLLTLSNISLFIFYLYFLIKEISNTLNIRGGIGIIKSEESYKILKNGKISARPKHNEEPCPMECGFISCANPDCDFHTNCDLEVDGNGEYRIYQVGDVFKIEYDEE